MLVEHSVPDPYRSNPRHGCWYHSPLQISYLPKVTQSVTGRCGSREFSSRDCYLYYTILLSYYQLNGEQATGWKNEQRGSFKVVRKAMWDINRWMGKGNGKKIHKRKIDLRNKREKLIHNEKKCKQYQVLGNWYHFSQAFLIKLSTYYTFERQFISNLATCIKNNP